MGIEVRKRGDVAVAKARGEVLDASNADEFKRDMRPIIEEHERVVLDISNIQFVDSSGLGAFLLCLKQLESAGGGMKICGMTRPVRTLFELVGMHRICGVYDNVDDAVKAFAE